MHTDTGVTSPFRESVKRAMLMCPRGLFVPEPHARSAYADSPIRVKALGFNISAPHIHANALSVLDIQLGERCGEEDMGGKVWGWSQGKGVGGKWGMNGANQISVMTLYARLTLRGCLALLTTMLLQCPRYRVWDGLHGSVCRRAGRPGWLRYQRGHSAARHQDVRGECEGATRQEFKVSPWRAVTLKSVCIALDMLI